MPSTSYSTPAVSSATSGSMNSGMPGVVCSAMAVHTRRMLSSGTPCPRRKSLAASAPSTSNRRPLDLCCWPRPMSWNIAPTYSSSGSKLRSRFRPCRLPQWKTRREWSYTRSLVCSRTNSVAARASLVSGIWIVVMPSILIRPRRRHPCPSGHDTHGSGHRLDPGRALYSRWARGRGPSCHKNGPGSGRSAVPPAALLRRFCLRSQRNRLLPGCPPLRDDLIGVHRPHPDMRAARRAQPGHDPLVQLGDVLPHQPLGRHVPHGFRQPLDFLAQLEGLRQQRVDRAALPSQVAARPPFGVAQLTAVGQRLSPARQVVELPPLL